MMHSDNVQLWALITHRNTERETLPGVHLEAHPRGRGRGTSERAAPGGGFEGKGLGGSGRTRDESKR